MPGNTRYFWFPVVAGYNDIQMAFLHAPVNEQKYQNMLSLIDYQLVHGTVPSLIHDIVLIEESDTSPLIMTG